MGAIGMGVATEAIANQGPAEAVAAMKQQALAEAHHAGDVSLFGLLAAGASVICLSISLMKSEPGWRIGPLLILTAYALLAFAFG